MDHVWKLKGRKRVRRYSPHGIWKLGCGTYVAYLSSRAVLADVQDVDGVSREMHFEINAHHFEGAVLDVGMWKRCMLSWPDAFTQMNTCKTTFWRLRIEAVDGVVARSACRSQNVKNSLVWGPYLASGQDVEQMHDVQKKGKTSQGRTTFGRARLFVWRALSRLAFGEQTANRICLGTHSQTIAVVGRWRGLQIRIWRRRCGTTSTVLFEKCTGSRGVALISTLSNLRMGDPHPLCLGFQGGPYNM